MTEKKAWQHGYNMEDLLQLEGFYQKYNQYSMSPFSTAKKNTLAESLHKRTLKLYREADWPRPTQRLEGQPLPVVAMDKKVAAAATSIVMYKGVPIGRKIVGDITITKMAWADGAYDKAKHALLAATKEAPCWFYVWTEDAESNRLAKECGFKWVGTKITTFSEMVAIYFCGPGERPPRQHPTRPLAEDVDCVRIHRPGRFHSLEAAQEEVRAIGDFANHYSNYNKAKSWSALALRGYSPDPGMIGKPSEMNKQWKEEHAGETFGLQDTPLRQKLPVINAIAERAIVDPDRHPVFYHRVRLMKLAPGGGTLERHTDQADPDSGVQDGRAARFHIPLITNPGVIFTTWDVHGSEKDVHMKEGEVWYLDTRKPHRAVNRGDTPRVHLVIDVVSDSTIRSLLEDQIN